MSQNIGKSYYKCDECGVEIETRGHFSSLWPEKPPEWVMISWREPDSTAVLVDICKSCAVNVLQAMPRAMMVAAEQAKHEREQSGRAK
jgi:hypothetical protein